MKKLFSYIHFTWSDLFFLLAAGSFALFVGVGQSFMNQMDLTQSMPLPIWIFSLFGTMMIAFFGMYLYIEVFSKKEPYNKYVMYAFIGLVVLNLIAIFVQPCNGTEYVIVRYRPEESLVPGVVGQGYDVPYSITAIHKFFFAFEEIGMMLMIYTGLFIFPKRFKNLKFIEFIGYVLFIVCGFLAIYSYITEANQYVRFVEYVIGKDRDGELASRAVMSLFSHRNPLGMTYMLGIIFCFINHSFSRKWFHYPLAVFFFLNEIFTFCKTGLLLSVLISFIYLIYRLFVTYKDHSKRNLITFIVIGVLILVAALLIGVPYITKGKVFGKIYELINNIVGGGHTLETRTYIWDNGFQIISHGWWLLGRGMGIPNLIVKPTNIMSHAEDVISLHSGLLTVLCEGGVLLLLAYLAFLIYSGYVTVKSFKVNKDLTITLALGALTFLLYSLIESNHYLIFLFLFPIFILYHQREVKEETK